LREVREKMFNTNIRSAMNPGYPSQMYPGATPGGLNAAMKPTMTSPNVLTQGSSTIINQSLQKQLILLVDGSSALRDSIDKLRIQIIEPVIKSFNPTGTTEYCLILYTGYPFGGTPSVECSERTTDSRLLLYWLEKVKFEGGGSRIHALEEGLAQAYLYCRQNTENYVIVVTASEPSLLNCSALAAFNSPTGTMTFVDILKKFAEEKIKCSLVCPRNIALLQYIWGECFPGVLTPFNTSLMHGINLPAHKLNPGGVTPTPVSVPSAAVAVEKPLIDGHWSGILTFTSQKTHSKCSTAIDANLPGQHTSISNWPAQLNISNYLPLTSLSQENTEKITNALRMRLTPSAASKPEHTENYKQLHGFLYEKTREHSSPFVGVVDLGQGFVDCLMVYATENTGLAGLLIHKSLLPHRPTLYQ